jgi:hypothetical protein
MIRRMLVLVAVACLLGGCSGNETPPDDGATESSVPADSALTSESTGGAGSPGDSADVEDGEDAPVEEAPQGEAAGDDEPSAGPAEEGGAVEGDSDPTPSIEDVALVNEPSPDMVPASGLRVLRAYVCKGIEQSEPTEAGKSFVPEDGVLRLCCFSEIAGAQGPDTVLHIWRWGEREMARVELEVKSSRWRTWSTKRILDEWRGEWHVDIADGDGTVLTTLDFSVE